MTEPRPKSSHRVVNPDVLQLAPSLLHAPLATPWQRLGGFLVDLGLISLLSRFSSPILGLCAGATLLAFASQRESDEKFFRIFRWVLVGVGGVIILLSGFLATRSPIFQPRRAGSDAPAAVSSAERPPIPLLASDTNLRERIRRLQAEVDALQTENAKLRALASEDTVVNAVTGLPAMIGLAFGWAGVYFTLLPTFFGGRTPGKFIVGSRVVRLDGNPPTAIDCFWRSGGYPAGLATGCLGFVRLIWEPNHQALQDNIAGTLVIRAGYKVKTVKGTVAPPDPARVG